MKNKLVALLGVAAGVAGGGALFSQAPAEPQQPSLTSEKAAGAAEVAALVNANNQFALDAYSELRKDTGNIFFSPYGISAACAMAYEGARGKTADEIRAVFHFPKDNASRRAGFAALHAQLNAPGADYLLSIANALWAQSGYKLLSDYIDVVARYYSGKAANVDFKGATEDARNTINRWVEDHTGGKIKDLFPRGSLTGLTRLVLTNAVYFKGQWASRFDKALTADEDFYPAPASPVKVPMMRQTGKDAKFAYAEDDTAQVLEMPYKGGALSMLILLPKSAGLSSLEEALSPRKLAEWTSALRNQRVDVMVPRFTFDRRYSLNNVLSKLGMPAAFTEAADFSGMDGTRSLSIQSVVHQAFVDVNEEGTEAAAATGLIVGITSLPPPVPVFRADHPFIFLIRETRSGNILFMGRVANPAP